jgi:hypothetical protein
MMGYEFPGPTCQNFTWADKQMTEKEATIRIDDIFKKCTKTGLLSAKPTSVDECLIFVTLASNVTNIKGNIIMGNNPKKTLVFFQKEKFGIIVTPTIR